MKKKRLKPEAKATAAFGLLAFLFLSLTASFQVVVASTAGTSAEKTPSCHLNGDILTCQLRTLSDFNNSADTDTVPLGAVEASRTQHLVLKCSEFNQESILRTNHFGYLPNLQKLSVDSCWLRKIPSLAFSGLSGLIGLSLINTGGGGGGGLDWRTPHRQTPTRSATIICVFSTVTSISCVNILNEYVFRCCSIS